MGDSIKVVNYIGFYALEEYNAKEKRMHSMAAVRKMDYISEVLIEAGYNVNIISPTWSEAESGYFHAKTLKIGEHKNVTYCSSFGAKSKALKKMRILVSYIWLIFWIIFNVKKGEKIIVYHSPLLTSPLRIARLFKKFIVILEIEEIYDDILKLSERMKYLEYKIISIASSFIFSTDLLVKRINLQDRKYVIVYGEYKVISRKKILNNDGKIHVVYAGRIEKEVGRAFYAVESANFLSDNYVLNIIGSGSESDIDNLTSRINEINSKKGCRVIYHELKHGQDYIDFMQTCHIGLNTQKMEANCWQSSFPSKVLSYICFGLQVVSSHIPCIFKSKIHDMIYYYYQDTPEAIANAIMSVNIKGEYNSFERISSLHNELVINIKALLSD